MNANRTLGLACIVLLPILLTGCASDKIYRHRFSECTVSSSALDACAAHSLQRYNAGEANEYSLAFVEVDDQGQLRDREQLKLIKDRFNEIAGSEPGVLLHVFVHGWHHNAAADPEDPNITSFRDTLQAVSAAEDEISARQQLPRRKVLGVYVGWRGESIALPGIRYLTFWDRKSTAEEVGHLGVSEILLTLEEIRNVKNTQDSPVKSRLVIMGHSFGGAVIYTAAAQILASRFINTALNKGYADDPQGLGDLVVLLNPAFQALNFAPLYDLAQSRCSYSPEQKPKLVILTSEGDQATATAFPLGRVFSTFFETHNTLTRQGASSCGRPLKLAEGAADRAAVGHFQPLITHTLTRIEKPSAKLDLFEMSSLWKGQEDRATTLFGSTKLTHLGKTHPHNPFLNVRVSKDIIPDHNDIFKEEIAEFLRGLIVLTGSHSDR